ncbi:MAG: bifunctional 3-deoxy-7-phosphoheptulonate synthase/chorismate mutase [Deltaproteobacteria bacterium]|nr:bifunctional 3-deoxy-7-phosphoheptulonate synthase/chorismate mutase [Deltaproteobacteria bacterium]
MFMKSLEQMREDLVSINISILDLLCQRARVALDVQQLKKKEGIPLFVPEREQKMLSELVSRNRGPFPDETIRHLFKEIFRASVSLMEKRTENAMCVSRSFRSQDLVIQIGDKQIGKDPIVIAGPCSVESAEQMDQIGGDLSRLGINFLRGGTFKPRSSPYAFQGMGEPGLKILKDTARRYGMISVTEVMDTRAVELVSEYADVLQIGTRNMYNYSLLREVGRSQKPVLLKRGFAATIEEFLWAAEYIVSEGNQNVILCERGIRTFERQTRNTLDISAIPLIRQMSFLPIIVDVSHAAGRKDILAPLGRAALAAGANGLMVEVHPFPPVARSDSQQQLDVGEFSKFLVDVGLDPRPVEEVAGLLTAQTHATRSPTQGASS